MKNVKN